MGDERRKERFERKRGQSVGTPFPFPGGRLASLCRYGGAELQESDHVDRGQH